MLKKVEKTVGRYCATDFDTTDVVSITMQTILSSHTANKMKLSDGERKQMTQNRLEKLR
jgi:hypothetical protein